MQRNRDGTAGAGVSEPPGDLAIPQVIASEKIFDGRMIGLRVDTLQLPDGTTHRREIVEYGIAVVLVPIDADGRLLLVRQYRHATGAWLLELPAGGMDEDDASPEVAAQRELREETGRRGTLTRIGGMFLAPGYSEEYQHVFAANDLIEDALEADEDEDLRLERVTLDDALKLIDSGEIRDAKSIAGLLLYLRHIGRAG
jgi:ADP-ribose pyrophosphatase